VSRVLVIDDDRDIRETLAAALELVGHQALLAEDGRQGLEQLRGDGHPQLVLLDLMMPRMNGWEFRAAQLADPELALVPVLLITAHEDGVRTARELGTAGCIRKPVDLDSLLEAVERHARQD